MLLLLALLSPGWAGHAPGETLSPAAGLDVTEAGFEALGDFLPELIPETIEIPYQESTGSSLCDYGYSLSNAWVGLQVLDAAVEPSNGLLEITADLMVWVNDASDPFQLSYWWDCGFLGDGDDTCDGTIAPFPATFTLDLALSVVTDARGQAQLDATVQRLDVSYDLTGDDIALSNCSVGDIEDFLNLFGISLYDWVLGYVDGAIQDQLDSVASDIESTIEDAFSQASIHDTYDLMGTSLQVDLEPSDVQLVPEGMRVVMDGSLSVEEASDCVADYDPGESLATDSDLPPLGDAPAGISPDYHLALLLSDDLMNQGLYALWRGGLLCYTLDDSSSFSMSSSMLSLLGTDAFDELFPENVPLTVVTRPREAPTAALDGPHDVDVAISSLGVDIYGEVDGRQALVLGLDIDGTVGADLDLDPATGELSVDLDLSADELHATVRSDEFEPDSAGDIEAGFGGLLGTLVDSLLGGSLSGLSFELPSYEGIGLTSLEVATAGSQGDWLGAYGELGEVSYGGDGCQGSDGGEASSGCSTAGGRRGWLLLPVLGLLLFRRRQD